MKTTSEKKRCYKKPERLLRVQSSVQLFISSIASDRCACVLARSLVLAQRSLKLEQISQFVSIYSWIPFL